MRLDPPRTSPATPDSPRPLLKQAVILAVTATLLALLVNAVRPDGLPLVATTPYETLVPCPEPQGVVAPITAGAALAAKAFFVDAREAEAYADAHLPGAVSLPFDYLDAVPKAALGALTRQIVLSGASQVAVYGDGGSPDSGEELAKEIAFAGIKNVTFIQGGVAALAAAGAMVPGTAP
ncbi:MAG: rhodanese-like domain-containing protein [Deltaproteobacteria bacterium]|nr:rhodanese-like domain-containing protein [Deltaproteobacteria bacterium]